MSIPDHLPARGEGINVIATVYLTCPLLSVEIPLWVFKKNADAWALLPGMQNEIVL